MYINRIWLTEVDFIVFKYDLLSIEEIVMNSLVVLLIREFVVSRLRFFFVRNILKIKYELFYNIIVIFVCL